MTAASEPLLSVILPTYNERENVSVLVPRVLDILRNVPCEVIVVDDSSPDGTADTVREMGASDSRIRLLERPGKAGLASAVFAGAAEAQGRLVAVMDADLSHDPEVLPEMLARAEDGYDVVIGSRYVQGGAFAHQPLVPAVDQPDTEHRCTRHAHAAAARRADGLRALSPRTAHADADALLITRVQVAAGIAGGVSRAAGVRVAHHLPKPLRRCVQGGRTRGTGTRGALPAAGPTPVAPGTRATSASAT